MQLIRRICFFFKKCKLACNYQKKVDIKTNRQNKLYGWIPRINLHCLVPDPIRDRVSFSVKIGNYVLILFYFFVFAGIEI